MHNCNICGEDKKNTKLYELEFWKDIKDTIFICDECLPIQEETSKIQIIAPKGCNYKRIEITDKQFSMMEYTHKATDKETEEFFS